nr:hypothetical protein BaRGS_010150 [Batillaria attramentaria]
MQGSGDVSGQTTGNVIDEDNEESGRDHPSLGDPFPDLDCVAQAAVQLDSCDGLPSLAPLGSKLAKDDIVRDLVFESTETI